MPSRLVTVDFGNSKELVRIHTSGKNPSDLPGIPMMNGRNDTGSLDKARFRVKSIQKELLSVKDQKHCLGLPCVQLSC